MVALLELSVFGQAHVIVLVEIVIVESGNGADNLNVLEYRAVSESNDWSWVRLSDIARPLNALPHAFDKAWYLLVRDKYDETAWK